MFQSLDFFNEYLPQEWSIIQLSPNRNSIYIFEILNIVYWISKRQNNGDNTRLVYHYIAKQEHYNSIHMH